MMEMNEYLKQFFRRLAVEDHGWLLLDYDGTIAPFVRDRLEARPAPGLSEAVMAILHQARTRVVFVTGRPCLELLTVSGFPRGLEIWGCHGREYLAANGELRTVGVSEPQAQALRAMADTTRQFLTQGLVEEKTGCLAVHWRSVPIDHWESVASQVRALWEPVRVELGLLIKAFDGGLELCTPGRTKGDAIEALLSEVDQPPPVAFLGDDLTDEDGFAALGNRGLSVLVRNEPRSTRANVRVTMPDGIRQFLHHWKQTLDQGVGHNE